MTVFSVGKPQVTFDFRDRRDDCSSFPVCYFAKTDSCNQWFSLFEANFIGFRVPSLKLMASN